MAVPASSSRPPKVSIVSAAYNRAKEIRPALDSMLSQSFQDIEIIVVDDGSTDGTADIVRSYGDQVRLVQRENGGVGAARNTGIRAARGEYLTYCDSDDIHFPYRVEAQVKVLDRYPEVAMCFADFKEWRNGEKIVRESTLRGRWLGPTPRTWDEELVHHFSSSERIGDLDLGPIPAEYADRRVYKGFIHRWLCSVHAAWGGLQMARTECIRMVGGHWEAIRAYEDYVLASELSKRWPLAYIDIPTCLYRVHSEQLTGRQRLNAECFRDSLLHAWRADPRFYKLHKDIIDMALGTSYAVIGEVEARDGNWAAAEEAFKRAVFEWSGVGRRPYANLVLTAIRHRVPLSRTGLLDKIIPGFLPMAANTGIVVDE